jgi:hypothetical protein
MAENQQTQLWTQLSALKEQTAALGEHVSKQEAQITGLREDVRKVVDRLESLVDRLSEKSRPQYGTWIASGALIVTVTSLIIGGFGSGFIRDIKRVEETGRIERELLKREVFSNDSWGRSDQKEYAEIQRSTSAEVRDDLKVNERRIDWLEARVKVLEEVKDGR